MRHVLLVAAGFATLLVLALGAGASHTTTIHLRSGGAPVGLVPPHVGGQRVGHFKTSRPGFRGAGSGAVLSAAAASLPQKRDNLTYSGPDQSGTGPVMRSNEVYAIYWAPGGYSFPGSYQSTVDTFFQDVAADSGTNTNVYSAANQYSDTTGAIAYDSGFGGSAVDTNAYPTSDCTMPSDVIGTSVCMSDGALQAEVKAFADAQGWTAGPNTEFFLFTPQNVGTCIYNDTAAAANGGNICSYDYYCAYHSAFFDNSDTEYIYANMAFPNQTVQFGGVDYASDCDTGQHPNGDGTGDANDANAADAVISVTSHEHNESITDPLGSFDTLAAWWDDNPKSPFSGDENGDLCAWSWFYPKGPTGMLGGDYGQGTAYNQSINGDHYFIQGEWSNSAATTAGWSGCVWNTVAKSAKPTIGSFLPSGGPAGTVVTIDGANFLSTKSVKFNGKPAAFDVQNAGEITATLPAGANTGKIAITTGAGTVTSSDSFSVLQIKSFGPPKGTGGTTVVTINGSGFTGATAVQFNGTDADAFTVVSDTKITATAATSGTTGTISVTTPDGTATSAKPFGYIPSVASFSPSSGVEGGTVTITGTSFTGATAVKIGGKAAAFTVDSDTQISATVPLHPTSGKISVKTPGGTATSSTSWTAIAIKSFTPAKGLFGTHVTVTGAGFTGATSVAFGGIGGDNLNVASDTRITVDVPCINAGNVTLSVVTPNGTVTAAKLFKNTTTCT